VYRRTALNLPVSHFVDRRLVSCATNDAANTVLQLMHEHQVLNFALGAPGWRSGNGAVGTPRSLSLHDENGQHIAIWRMMSPRRGTPWRGHRLIFLLI
jgi:hypothetical protein